MKKKVLVLVSGGIDSMYILREELHKGNEVVACCIDEGNPNHIEQQMVRKICKDAGVEVESLSILSPSQTEIPDHPLSIKHATNYLAGYKCMMYAVALSKGMATKCDEVAFGVYEWNDHFYDETPEAARLFRDTWARIYFDTKVPEIVFPLFGNNKANVIKDCAEKGYDLANTYSCFHQYTKVDEAGKDVAYERHVHCGSCLGCMDRKNSFAKAGVVDPTEYLG